MAKWLKFNDGPVLIAPVDALAHLVIRMHRLTVRNKTVLIESIPKIKDASSYQK